MKGSGFPAACPSFLGDGFLRKAKLKPREEAGRAGKAQETVKTEERGIKKGREGFRPLAL